VKGLASNSALANGEEISGREIYSQEENEKKIPLLSPLQGGKHYFPWVKGKNSPPTRRESKCSFTKKVLMPFLTKKREQTIISEKRKKGRKGILPRPLGAASRNFIEKKK